MHPILNKVKPKEKTPPPSNQTAGDGQADGNKDAPSTQSQEQMDVE